MKPLLALAMLALAATPAQARPTRSLYVETGHLLDVESGCEALQPSR